MFGIRNKSYIRSVNTHFMSNTKTIRPTESELEILQTLWTKGLATVREVHEDLAKTKDVGYTHDSEINADHARKRFSEKR
jgi:BlaI family penicillinase repressor